LAISTVIIISLGGKKGSGSLLLHPLSGLLHRKVTVTSCCLSLVTCHLSLLVTHTLTHSLTYSLTYSLTHSLTHSHNTCVIFHIDRQDCHASHQLSATRVVRTQLERARGERRPPREVPGTHSLTHSLQCTCSNTDCNALNFCNVFNQCIACTHAFTHTLTHAFTHTLTHSLTHSHTHSLTAAMGQLGRVRGQPLLHAGALRAKL
jgi:hypothetical protein